MHLKLFVSGKTARSATAIENIEEIAARKLAGRCTFEVIDIQQNPEASVQAGIIATPALIKTDPPPVKKLIGDFSDHQRVVDCLGRTKARNEY